VHIDAANNFRIGQDKIQKQQSVVIKTVYYISCSCHRPHRGGGMVLRGGTAAEDAARDC